MNKKTMGIIGDGQLGTSLAQLFARNGNDVLLWCHNPQNAENITAHHTNNAHLPGIILNEKVKATTKIQDLITHSDLIIEAVPTATLREVLKEALIYSNQSKKGQFWVASSKGIEAETNLLPTQIIQDVLGSHITAIVLEGPSVGTEIAENKFSWIELAGNNTDMENEAIKVFCESIRGDDQLVIKISKDPLGIQACSAFKHAISLGNGIINSMNTTEDNAKALLLTQGIKEIAQLIPLFGGKAETVLSLAGIGDISISSLGTHSRNVKMGNLIEKGAQAKDIIQETGLARGGLNVLQAAHDIAKKHALNLNLFNTLYAITYEHAQPETLLQALRYQGRN
jgi:glycerol-3-phosphate dehydrogenase (NAD(P)+)